MPVRKRRTDPGTAGPGTADFAIRRETLAVAIVVLVAALVRVIYLLQYKNLVPYYAGLIVDSQYYDEWARRVANGTGYGPGPFYLAPLYPYVLALVYYLSDHSLPAVYVIQAILGLANTLLVYVLGRRLFGHAAGMVAMVLLLLYAPVLFFESKILSETLALTLGLLGIVLLLKASDRPSALRFLAAGVVLGLCAVCRPVTLLTALLAFAWVWYTARSRAITQYGVSALVPLALGILVPIAVTAGRNYLVGGDSVLISANGGLTFAQGNNRSATGTCVTVLPGFTGSIMMQQAEEVSIAEKRLGHPVTASESSAYWLGQGLKFAREHPGRYLNLVGRKLLWSLHARESPCSYNFNLERRLVPALRFLFLPFSLLAGFALFGFVRARQRDIDGGVSLLGLYVLSIFAGLVIFFVTSRYRLPATPALAVFAGFGLSEIATMYRERRLRTAVPALIPAAAVMLLSVVPYPIPAIGAEGPADLGASYLILGQTDRAIEQFREALKIAPDYGFVHTNLGDALRQRGSYDEAVAEFQKAIRLNPSDWAAHLSLGSIFVQQGKLDEAITHFSAGLVANPRSAELHNNLAVAFFLKGEYSAAWREVKLCWKYGGNPEPSFLAELSRMMPEP